MAVKDQIPDWHGHCMQVPAYAIFYSGTMYSGGIQNPKPFINVVAYIEVQGCRNCWNTSMAYLLFQFL